MRQNHTINKNTIEAWDEIYKAKKNHRVHQWLDPVLNFYLKKAKSIIEVGCGVGKYLSYLKTLNPNKSFTGVDYSKVAIDRAKMSGIIQYKVWDIEKYPNPFNHTFDLVMCIETLEHTNFPHKIMMRLNDLCSKDGVVIITVPKYNSILDTNKVNWHYWSFTPDDFTNILGDKLKFVYPDNNHMIVILDKLVH